MLEDKSSKHLLEENEGESSCKDSLEEVYPSIESLLESCSLEDYIELFQKEKIDLSSLVFTLCFFTYLFNVLFRVNYFKDLKNIIPVLN